MMQLLLVFLASYFLVASSQCSASQTCAQLGYPGQCCSQWGWCGTDAAHCGSGCQNGPCTSGGGSSSGSSSGSSNGGSTLSGNTIATWYCSLTDPNTYSYCYNTGDPNHEADCTIDVTKIGSSLGVAANNPLLFSKGSKSVCSWNGANCGTCYRLTGPGGSKTVMVTDCCAGYSGNCQCDQGCTDGQCDWCAANSHNHFDLDYDSFLTVCGSQASNGHCSISTATVVGCPSNAVSDNNAQTTAQLSPGLLAGVVVGSMVGLVLTVLVLVLTFRKSSMEVV